MESLDPVACLVDELLDFASDIGEEDDDDDKKPAKRLPSVRTSRSSSEIVGEEELEWISNKDAFPAVETLFVDTLPDHNGGAMKHPSPVSVLENSNSSTSTSTNTNGSTVTNGSLVMYCCGSLRVPVKARSKCRRRFRHDLRTTEGWWVHENAKNVAVTTMGRKCQHCGAEKTPQWRAGPLGPKTLCNACGVRYKSGRLCDEYRPASSPTFSCKLHSNSHRKILEMRKQKQQQQQQLSMLVVKPVDKG